VRFKWEAGNVAEAGNFHFGVEMLVMPKHLLTFD
jgi:hypothetical protein